MRHSSCQAAHGLHLLRLPKLIFQHALVGHVFSNHLQQFRAAFLCNRLSTQSNSDRTAIFPLPFDFDIINSSAAQVFPFEHRHQRRVHIQKATIECGAVDAIHCALYQRAITSFGESKRLFVAFMLDCARHVLRNKGKNFFFLLPVADPSAVALHYQHAKGGIARLQGCAQPVNRRRADGFHLALLNQFLKHIRCGQKGLASTQNVFRQTLSQWLGFWRRILLVHEIGKIE